MGEPRQLEQLYSTTRVPMATYRMRGFEKIRIVAIRGTATCTTPLQCCQLALFKHLLRSVVEETCDFILDCQRALPEDGKMGSVIYVTGQSLGFRGLGFRGLGFIGFRVYRVYRV